MSPVFPYVFKVKPSISQERQLYSEDKYMCSEDPLREAHVLLQGLNSGEETALLFLHKRFLFSHWLFLLSLISRLLLTGLGGNIFIYMQIHSKQRTCKYYTNY